MLYSHSRLSTFEQCPFRYKLRYIQKIEAEIPETIETFLGSRVHDVLEKLYQDLDHQKTNSLEELLEYFHTQWMKHWSDDIKIVKQRYSIDSYQKMGEKYISDFYNHYFPFDSERTIALENRIIIDLDEKGKYKMQGYIDRLAERGDGNYEIHDYKTNSRLPTPEHIRKDRQLALYALGVKKQYPQVKDISLIWHFLKFDKEITSSRTDEELKQLKQDMIMLIKRIEKTRSFPTKPSVLCNWCEYKPMCPQWSHLFLLNEKPENEYHSNSNVHLVDRYVALKQKKKQVKLDVFAEIDQLEEKLIKFAKEKNVEILSGTEHNVQIIRYMQYLPPEKKSSLRKRLEQELKSEGKWEKIKPLNTSIVNKILQDQEKDTLLQGILRKYVSPSEKIQIKIIKKTDKKEGLGGEKGGVKS